MWTFFFLFFVWLITTSKFSWSISKALRQKKRWFVSMGLFPTNMSLAGVLNPKSGMFITIHRDNDRRVERKAPNEVSCKHRSLVSSTVEKYSACSLRKSEALGARCSDLTFFYLRLESSILTQDKQSVFWRPRDSAGGFRQAARRTWSKHVLVKQAEDELSRSNILCVGHPKSPVMVQCDERSTWAFSSSPNAQRSARCWLNMWVFGFWRLSFQVLAKNTRNQHMKKASHPPPLNKNKKQHTFFSSNK